MSADHRADAHPPPPLSPPDPRERWMRVSALLDVALGLSDDERDAFLGGIEDPELSGEVARLLAASARAASDAALVTGGAAMLAGDATVPTEAPSAFEARVRAAVAGTYEVQREIGRGGMAVVYLARDVRHDRHVALKVVRPEVAAFVTAGRFLQEIRIAATLSHPHILPLLGSGEAAGLVYYAMPFIEGPSLRQRLASEGRLPVKEATRIAREAAQALDYAHRHGVVHRDVKPDNILLSDGQAVIADFGIARAMGAASTEPMTVSGFLVGTPEYMSPEQAVGERDIDGRSDVFSLGCVLYELLTGSTPFAGATAQARIAARLTRAAPSVREARAEVSEALAGVVAKALMTVPGERYSTAREFSAALEALADRGAVVDVSPAPRDGGERRRRFGAVEASAALFSVVAIAAWLILGEPKPLEVESTIRMAQEPEPEVQPALSPNGEFVAYAAGWSRTRRIVVRPVRGGRAMTITDTTLQQQGVPAWSPDGSRIAFHARGGIYIVPASGGLARRVIGLADAKAVTPTSTTVSDPAWSPDGTRLAYATGSAMHTVSVDGGVPREVVRAPEAYAPRWSPDGEWLVFLSFIQTGTPGTTTAGSAIIVVRVRDGATHTLTDRSSLNGPAVWTPDGKAVMFVSTRGGGSDVYWLGLRRDRSANGTPVRLTTGTRASYISMSADGRRLVYDDERIVSNVVSIDVDTQRVQLLREAKPVTRGDQVIVGMSLSPGGEWLAFDSNREGSFSRDIYRLRLPDGEIERLTDDPGDDLIPSWSPDGRQMAFYSLRAGSRDVYTMNADGSEQRRVTDWPGTEEWADWSPDGTRLVFESEDNAKNGVFLVTRESAGRFGLPRQLADSGATPVWSPDGRWIAYAVSGRVDIVSPDSGRPRTLWVGPPMRQGAHPLSGRVEWSSDGRAVYYRATRVDGGWSLWAIPLAGGRPRELVRNDDATLGTSDVFAVHGGRLYLGSGGSQSDIWMVTFRPQ